jgi:hypothetical protein
MTRYKSWMYDVRRISHGFWTFDLSPRPGAPTHYSIGEVHGSERDARRQARAAIDAEIAGLC